MNKTILKIHDKEFEPLIFESEINEKIRAIAHQINALEFEELICLSVLNGAYMFTAELCKHLHNLPVISFIKIASYQGIQTSGTITELVGIQENLKNKTVLILEDIIDTGNSIDNVYNACIQQGANKVYIATLLYKPDAYKGNTPIQFIGFSIPNSFVVGYGMDYNGLGRNLKDIYVLHTNKHTTC
ncbi:MAG TPA: phosphoribosyltransferase family protein [Bacteroidales bacterium]|nr:phosphoribosyltransferase family protein [Bacteroidales bacterium]